MHTNKSKSVYVKYRRTNLNAYCCREIAIDTKQERKVSVGIFFSQVKTSGRILLKIYVLRKNILMDYFEN